MGDKRADEIESALRTLKQPPLVCIVCGQEISKIVFTSDQIPLAECVCSKQYTMRVKLILADCNGRAIIEKTTSELLKEVKF